jgi:hypothetical protein
MQVYVNDNPVDLLPGMTVRHALVAAGRLGEISAGKRVVDEWGNELGLDGALSEGMRVFVTSRQGTGQAR